MLKSLDIFVKKLTACASKASFLFKFFVLFFLSETATVHSTYQGKPGFSRLVRYPATADAMSFRSYKKCTNLF